MGLAVTGSFKWYISLSVRPASGIHLIVCDIEAISTFPMPVQSAIDAFVTPGCLNTYDLSLVITWSTCVQV